MLVSITWILELRLNLQAWFASDFCRLCSCFSALLRSGACHRQFGLRNPLSKHLCDSKLSDVVDVRVPASSRVTGRCLQMGLNIRVLRQPPITAYCAHFGVALSSRCLIKSPIIHQTVKPTQEKRL